MVGKAEDHNQRAGAKKGIGARVKKTIGELLVSEGLIEPEHIEEALSIQKREGRRIVQTLIDLGHIDVVTFAKFMAASSTIPSINLSNYQIHPEICAHIPRALAMNYHVFPIDKMGKLLTVGSVAPLNAESLKTLEDVTGLKVKLVLCSREDIQTAIERYYVKEESGPGDVDSVRKGVENALKFEKIAELVRSIEALPTLPETVDKVEKASMDNTTSIKTVAEIVAFDPPISAKLLQIANSAAYGLPSIVDDVTMAAKLLGLKEVYRIVLSSAVINMVEKSNHFDHRRFWDSSRFCALAAKNVSNASNLTPSPGLFTCGLLLDIGRFALTEIMPKRYSAVSQKVIGAALVEEEEKTLGIAHPEVGYLLATHWRLPEEVAEAIRFHHAPLLATKSKETAAIVALASRMTEAHDGGLETAESVVDGAEDILALTKLDPDAALRIYHDTLEMSKVERA